jgi:hypothetical protein
MLGAGVPWGALATSAPGAVAAPKLGAGLWRRRGGVGWREEGEWQTSHEIHLVDDKIV